MLLSPAQIAQLTWRKSRRSLGSGACVEVAAVAGGVAVRDSKNPDGPVLIYTVAEWRAFVDGARNGEFDDLSGPSGQERELL